MDWEDNSEFDFQMVLFDMLPHLKGDSCGTYSMVVLKKVVKEISPSGQNKLNAISMSCFKTTFNFFRK